MSFTPWEMLSQCVVKRFDVHVERQDGKYIMTMVVECIDGTKKTKTVETSC